MPSCSSSNSFCTVKILCRVFQFIKPDPGLLRLDLPVKLVDVIRDRNKHALSQHILHSPVQVLPEPHVFLDNGKGPFSLYAAVHPELCTIVAQDPFKVLSPLFFLGPRYIKDFAAFRHRGPAVVPFNAFIFKRTSGTFAAFVDC